MLDYDPSCLTFDSVTDAEPLGNPDGVPDAVGDIPTGFEVTVDHQGDDITLLVKSPGTRPWSCRKARSLSLEFGLTGSNKCPNTQASPKRSTSSS